MCVHSTSIAYVDTNMVGGGLAQAAIIGQQGGIWATSSGLQVREEIGKYSAAMQKSSMHLPLSYR